MHALRFGGITLGHGLMLAPLAGVSDAPFRYLCRRFGAEYTVSEMVSAKALCFEQQSKREKHLRTAPLARVTPEELPMAVQLFGSEPEFMARAAALLATCSYLGSQGSVAPVAIDINMGCPVPKVVSNGEGAALMKDIPRAAAIVRAVKAAVSLPVTVKIRAGWDEKSKNAVAMAAALEEAGADLICVHGRTRQQLYAPSADLSVIADVKKAVSVPVVGNGDLFCAADVVRMLEVTGCDGVMIARGAMGNPFIFAETLALLDGKSYTPPTPEERCRIAIEHAALIVKEKGERIGVPEARKHVAWYCKGLRGAATARNAVMHATTLEELSAAVALMTV